MMSVSNQIFRTTCAMCDLRTHSVLCDRCRSKSGEDFYLLLLTKLKDQGDDFIDLKAKCIDIHDAIVYYNVPETPLITFDQDVHTVNEHAQKLLENYTTMSTDDVVPVIVVGGGDCLFHSIQTFYPSLSIDELHSRCIKELCTHEQFYETLKTEMSLDLVDDESVQDHALQILNNSQYTGVLTIAALSTVVQEPTESIYPGVNDNDGYCELLNTVFTPRNEVPSSMETSVRVLWTGPKRVADRTWRANHFTPVLSVKQAIPVMESESSIEILNDNIEYREKTKMLPRTGVHSNRSTMTYTGQMTDGKENLSETITSASVFDKRFIFSETSSIIKTMTDAVKEGKIFEQLPKIVTNASIFLVKSTEENRISIRKDGNGIWKQIRSVKAAFVLKDSGKYQIVRYDTDGNLFYNGRVGNRYIAQSVNSNQVITMHRLVNIFGYFPLY